VQGSAQAFASELRRRLGRASAFVLHEETQVYRVAVKPAEGPPFQIDVAKLQGRDILADLGRRDFTANALALPLPPAPGPAPSRRGGEPRHGPVRYPGWARL